MKTLSLEEACGILDALGCGSDPIVWHSKDADETDVQTPSDLCSFGNHLKTASEYRITFTGERGKPLKGTLADMVKERLSLPHTGTPVRTRGETTAERIRREQRSLA